MHSIIVWLISNSLKGLATPVTQMCSMYVQQWNCFTSYWYLSFTDTNSFPSSPHHDTTRNPPSYEPSYPPLFSVSRRSSNPPSYPPSFPPSLLSSSDPSPPASQPTEPLAVDPTPLISSHPTELPTIDSSPVTGAQLSTQEWPDFHPSSVANSDQLALGGQPPAISNNTTTLSDDSIPPEIAAVYEVPQREEEVHK